MDIQHNLLCTLLLVLIPFSASGAEDESKAHQTVRVGLEESPPFVIHDGAGAYSGICMDLWRKTANALQLNSEYELVSLHELLDGVENGRFDIAVAPLTITPEREHQLDFSHAYYSSGLGVAVHRRAPARLVRVVARLVHSGFTRALLLLFLTLLTGGTLVWLFERKLNAEHFGGRWYEGIGAGLWWSAATISTVGYGDKSPRTLLGRFIGILWIFMGILVFSSFTAAVTTALTMSHFEASIAVPEDLAAMRIGALEDSFGKEYAQKLGLHPEMYASLGEAFAAIANGHIEAVVSDAPLMRYVISRDYPSTLEVLPEILAREQYGFAFPQGSSLREGVNRAMLDITGRQDWQETLVSYLGQGHSK